ncbi:MULTISPECIES: hypothetical protein [unclassified Streptomyces]|uniref:hypothetical protein n=1 Tax=unclassified Streptomyces TaxID=2593676 RepID=UPI002E126CB4|nr:MULTISPECIES: hypothetical protein [unclassified Streptomyces]WSR23443.1 hypothetical protein OG573_32925 [Streptomyces sp. NBC_01205]
MSGHHARSPLEIYDANVASGLAAVRQELAGLGQEVEGLGGRFEVLDQKIDCTQAQIIELLTQLVGRGPDAG